MKNHTKYLALISTTLLVAVFAGPANATTEISTPTADVQPETSISAQSTVSLSFEKTAVHTFAAEAPAPVAEPEPAPVAETPAPTQTGVAYESTGKVTTAVPTAPAKDPAPVVSASGKGAAIAAAAYAQLGVSQDCTALVTNSLAAVGIHFHDWPAGYLSLGKIVSAAEAQPGDLAYYANGGTGMAHIAVYVGGGKAVHGGWNGGTTALASVNIGSGPVFIRVA